MLTMDIRWSTGIQHAYRVYPKHNRRSLRRRFIACWLIALSSL